MLGRVMAGEVIREAKSGRTKPVLMLCEADTDGAIEVFCKLSAECFEGVTSLAREVVAACLAIDLNLPVPTPYLVEIPSTLASVVTDPDIAERLGASSPVGFGSMHAPAANFLKVRTRKTVGRLMLAFPDLDPPAFAEAMQAVDRGFSAIAKQAGKMSLFDARTDARAHALKVLPDDDSALQWSQTGTGLTADPTRTFERLYERYVARYDTEPVKRRSDDEVWQPVREKLMERGIHVPFEPKTVAGTQDRIVFERAWKNGRWHACEPVSLDMADAEGIMDKARMWRGHLAAVADGSSERIDVHFLLGRPQNGSLMGGYETAKTILAHAPFATEVVDEKDIDVFVTSMERACRLTRYADPGISTADDGTV